MYDLAECSETEPTGATQNFYPDFWTVDAVGDASVCIRRDDNAFPPILNVGKGVEVLAELNSSNDCFLLTWDSTPDRGNGFPQFNYSGSTEYTGEILSCGILANTFDSKADFKRIDILIHYQTGKTERVPAIDYVEQYSTGNTFSLNLNFDNMFGFDGLGGLRRLSPSGIEKIQLEVKSPKYGLGFDINVSQQVTMNSLLVSCVVSNVISAPKVGDSVRIWGQETTISAVSSAFSGGYAISFVDNIYKNNNEDTPRIEIIPQTPRAEPKTQFYFWMMWKYSESEDRIFHLNGGVDNAPKTIPQFDRDVIVFQNGELMSQIIRLDDVRGMNVHWLTEQMLKTGVNREPAVLLGVDSYDFTTSNPNPDEYVLNINASNVCNSSAITWLYWFNQVLIASGNSVYSVFVECSIGEKYTVPDSYLARDAFGNPIVNNGRKYLSWSNPFSVAMLKSLLTSAQEGALFHPQPKPNIGVWSPEWYFDGETLNIGLYDDSSTTQYVSETGNAVPIPYLERVDEITSGDITNNQDFLNWLSDKMADGFLNIIDGATNITRLHFDGTLAVYPEYNILGQLNLNASKFAFPAVDILFLSDDRLTLKEGTDAVCVATQNVFDSLGYGLGAKAYVAGGVPDFEKRWKWWRVDTCAQIALDADPLTYIYFNDISLEMRDGFQWYGSGTGFECGGGVCGC